MLIRGRLPGQSPARLPGLEPSCGGSKGSAPICSTGTRAFAVQREQPSRPCGPCPAACSAPAAALPWGFPAAEQAGAGGEVEPPLRAAGAGAGCLPVCHGAEQHALPGLAVAPRPLAQAPLGRSGFGGRWRGEEGLERGVQPRVERSRPHPDTHSQETAAAALSLAAVLPDTFPLDAQQCLQHVVHEAGLRGQHPPHGPGSAAEPEHPVSGTASATTPSTRAGPRAPELLPRLTGYVPVTVQGSLQQASGHLLRVQTGHLDKGPPQDVLERLLADVCQLRMDGLHNPVHLAEAGRWSGAERSHGPSGHRELLPSCRSLLASEAARRVLPSPGLGVGGTAPGGHAHRAVWLHTAYLAQLRARVSQDHLQHAGNRLGIRDPWVHHAPQDREDEVAPLSREEEAPKYLRERGREEVSHRVPWWWGRAEQRERLWSEKPRGSAGPLAQHKCRQQGLVWGDRSRGGCGEGAALGAEGAGQGDRVTVCWLCRQPALGGGQDGRSCCADAGLKPLATPCGEVMAPQSLTGGKPCHPPRWVMHWFIRVSCQPHGQDPQQGKSSLLSPRQQAPSARRCSRLPAPLVAPDPHGLPGGLGRRGNTQ